MKKKDLIITIIFVFTLIVPNILYWIFYDNMDHTNYENRSLYEKPVLKLSDIINFPKKYENYYNDNLAFKNEIRTKYSEILYDNFNMSSNKKVIVGKDGWLFYNSSGDGDSMNDYRRVNSYSVEVKEKIKNNLISMHDKLKDRGSKLFVFVAPNKENIYSEFMPDMININKEKEETPTDELINYLNETTDLNIIYPKQVLIDSKKIADTYYKYDTHWNDYGAYIGTIELMKVIKPSFKVSKINIQKKDVSGDLANMILMLNKLVNKEPFVSNFIDQIEPECEDRENLKFCRTKNALYTKTLLVVGDSFRENMVQYLSKIYRKTLFIHRDYYNDNLFYEYNPDIVVYEVVERYSYILQDSKILVDD